MEAVTDKGNGQQSRSLEGLSIHGVLDRAASIGYSKGLVLNKGYWLSSWIYYECNGNTCIVKTMDGHVLMIADGERPIVRVYDEREPEKCECNCGGGDY